MNRLLLLIFPFCACYLSACNIVNPSEPVPTFLQIDSFSFSNPDSNFTGSSSHAIQAVAVYANEQAMGTFDLPCRVPIIGSGNLRVKMVPQINNQGLKSYVTPYPFYEGDSISLEYKAGGITDYHPKTRYWRGLTSGNFVWKVNFEEGNLFKNLSGGTTIALESDPAKVIEGKYSGAIYLTNEVSSSESIAVNYVGYTTGDCFLEFDYKGSIPFQIGFQAEDPSKTTYTEYLAGFYPSAERKKIYLNAGNFIKAHSGYTKFFVKIRATLNDQDGTTYDPGYVLLDNFKIIAR